VASVQKFRQSLDAHCIAPDIIAEINAGYEDLTDAEKRRRPRFFVPLGVGAHLAGWGVLEEDIVELDWWESAELPGKPLKIFCTPARHFSGSITPSSHMILHFGSVFARS
jgi:L-ascorbate metabolism protein UlaG (beta-lactamase superfamily)